MQLLYQKAVFFASDKFDDFCGHKTDHQSYKNEGGHQTKLSVHSPAPFKIEPSQLGRE